MLEIKVGSFQDEEDLLAWWKTVEGLSDFLIILFFAAETLYIDMNHISLCCRVGWLESD